MFRREILDLVQPHFGGGSSTSSGTIAPELQGLMLGSGQKIGTVQDRNPLTDYEGRNPETVSPLSREERMAGGMARELGGRDPLEAMALRDILRAPQLAKAGPTTGEEDTDAIPGLGAFSDFLGYGADSQEIGQEEYNPENSDDIGMDQRYDPIADMPFNPVTGYGDKLKVGPTKTTGGHPPAYDAESGGPPPSHGNPTTQSLSVVSGGPPDVGTTPEVAVKQPKPLKGAPAGGLPPGTPTATGATWKSPPPSKYGVEAADFASGAKPMKGVTAFGDSPGVKSSMREVNEQPGAAISRRKVQGGTIETDPALKQALEHFRATSGEEMANQAALAGLGRSTALTTGLGRAEGELMGQMIPDSLAREERGIERELGQSEAGSARKERSFDRGTAGIESELGRRERSSVRGAEATERGVAQMLGLSQQREGRQQSAIDKLMSTGGAFRGVEQEGETAKYDDFIRRQAMSEQALYAPFGATLGGAMGSKVKSSK